MKRVFWGKLIIGFLVTIPMFAAMVTRKPSAQELLRKSRSWGKLMPVAIDSDRVTVMVPEQYWNEYYRQENDEDVMIYRPRTKMIFVMPDKNPTYDDLVNLPTLRDDLFTRSDLTGINDYNKAGLTPLQCLVRRKDATVVQIKALLQAGADVMMKTNSPNIYGNFCSTYRNAVDLSGESPADEPVGKFFENQCRGNAEVMQFLLNEILCKKLERIVLQRKEEEKIKIDSISTEVQEKTTEASQKVEENPTLQQMLQASLGLPVC